MNKVTVEISPKGETKIHVEGVQGMTCTETTAALEAALGGIVERELTDEAYAESAQEVSETLLA